MLLRDVMTTDVITASPQSSLAELVDAMIEHDVSGLPIVDAGRVVGVVSEADLVAHEAYPTSRRPRLSAIRDLLHGRRSSWWHKAAGATAADVMTAPVHTASPSDPVNATASRMLALGVKRFPVVDDHQRLVGIVTRRDLLRLMRRSDATIAAEVRSVLADGLRGLDECEVTLTKVEDGVVYLAGWTPSQLDVESRERIGSIVGAIPGVVEVRGGVGYRVVEGTIP